MFNVCPHHGVAPTLLPSRASQELADHRDENETERSLPLGRPFRMLLADDEPQNLMVGRVVYGDLIQNLPQGGRLDTCMDGAEALRMLGERDYDFLLTDIKMPHVDGISLIEQVREKHSGVWYGVLTGFMSDGLLWKVLELGGLFCLQKPWNVGHLKSIIETIISLRSLIGSTEGGIASSIDKEAILREMPNLFRLTVEAMKKPQFFRPAPGISPENSSILFPYIIGGLLHNAMNALVGLHIPIHRERSESRAVATGDQAASIVPAIEQLEMLLQLMQDLARGFYAQSEGAKPAAQLSQIIESVKLQNPSVAYVSDIDSAFNQVPLPIGVSEFILGELVRNATKSCTGNNGASVSLKVAVNFTGDTVSFECKDNGIGFSLEMLEKIRGQRLRPPKQRKAGGYGLYLIQELALRLHGSLLVSNLEPSGARVQVLLSTNVKGQ
jgi:CheY-like chemotaxis protein